MTDQELNELNETQAVIDVALASAEPTPLEEGGVYAAVVPAGGRIEVIDRDFDKYRHAPRRKSGCVTMTDSESFIAYTGKHLIPGATEIFADTDVPYKVTAVLNSDEDIAGLPGWRDHRVVLKLTPTTQWETWLNYDGNLLQQEGFADLVERRNIDFVAEQDGKPYPSGAEMLELAQHFMATKSARFEKSQRLKSGQTNLTYVEDIQATGGAKGNLGIPDVFMLALQPFEGAKTFAVPARFRYRIAGQELRVGYVLERPEDVARKAFDSVVTHIRDAFKDDAVPVFHGQSAAEVVSR